MRRYAIEYNVYQGNEFEIEYTYKMKGVIVESSSLENAIKTVIERQKKNGVGIDITKVEMI